MGCADSDFNLQVRKHYQKNQSLLPSDTRIEGLASKNVLYPFLNQYPKLLSGIYIIQVVDGLLFS